MWSRYLFCLCTTVMAFNRIILFSSVYEEVTRSLTARNNGFITLCSQLKQYSFVEIASLFILKDCAYTSG